MEVFFKPTFIKDFKSFPGEIREEVKELCTEIFPKFQDFREFSSYDFKSINGFNNYYRIRIGNYRVGFKTENQTIIFMLVRHRKDIYRYFP